MTSLKDLEGAAAPPRANGELVFGEPWESRAFAMVVSLAEAEVFSWQDFQEALIARIARHDAGSTPWRYYRHWLDALQDVLADRGAVQHDDVTVRASELSARPARHDHAPR